MSFCKYTDFPMECTVSCGGKEATRPCLASDGRKKNDRHAEIRSLRCFEAKFGTIKKSDKVCFVVKNNRGPTFCSKPCTLCTRTLAKRFPNGYCVYTDLEGKIIKEKFSEINDTVYSSKVRALYHTLH